MLIDGQKWSCEACVRGHRVTTCKHRDRPLTRINRKGRPLSTCSICHRTPCLSPEEHGKLRRETDHHHNYNHHNHASKRTSGSSSRYTRPFSGFLPIAPRPVAAKPSTASIHDIPGRDHVPSSRSKSRPESKLSLDPIHSTTVPGPESGAIPFSFPGFSESVPTSSSLSSVSSLSSLSTSSSSDIMPLPVPRLDLPMDLDLDLEIPLPLPMVEDAWDQRGLGFMREMEVPGSAFGGLDDVSSVFPGQMQRGDDFSTMPFWVSGEGF